MKEPDNVASVEAAVAAIKAGGFAIVVDAANRENEADLIMAAETATEDAVALMIRHTSGIICVPMSRARLEALSIEPMVQKNTDPFRTAFTVSVDCVHGTSTGVSAHDRTITIRELANPHAVAADFAKPGHIFPLISRPGGVLVRAGHTEAATDLARLAGFQPIGVLAELVNDNGTMKRGADIVEFAEKFDIPVVSIDAIISYRRQREKLVARTAEQLITTRHGDFYAIQYTCELDESHPFALISGSITPESTPLVRVHAENTYADAVGLHSAPHRAALLDAALARIAKSPCGILIYIPRHGSVARSLLLPLSQTRSEPAPLKATPQQWRETGLGSAVLVDLGVRRIRILGDTSKHYVGLEGFEIAVVDRLSIEEGE
jgi:3,4-dihydroxy 2-butanone 4-phosphate synthase/GTP cyclohydrolase II